MNNEFIDVSLNDSILKQLGYITICEEQEKKLIKDEENIVEVNIPATYNFEGRNYRITKIDNEAFKNYKKIQLITIPDTVTEIGESSFKGCSSLTKVTIPNNVIKIGSRAFSSCGKLTNIIIPDSVTHIGEYAFSWCWSLKSITLPNGITEISNNIFSSCESLKTITIPDSVTQIGKEAFGGCESLKSITIPDNVKEIGYNAFWDVDTIYYNGNAKGSTWGANQVINNNYDYIEVKLNETVLEHLGYNVKFKNYGEDLYQKTYLKKDGQYVETLDIPSTYSYKGKKYKIVHIGNCVTFWGCKSLKNVIIPKSVTIIGDSAFYRCESLTNITIPDSVTQIGYAAFCFC